MNYGKPFVFLSEALVTVNQPIRLIKKAVQEASIPWPGDDLLGAVWTNAAWSVRSQAALFRQADSSTKREKYARWLRDVSSEVVASLDVASEQRPALVQNLVLGLSRPTNYTCPQETRDFLSLLDKRNIGWGIIANEGPYYQAILKYLRLKPSILIDAKPLTFKPLPAIMMRALKRVPISSKDDVWFIGSVDRPYDNLAGSSALRTVLLAQQSDILQDSVNDVLQRRHFRVMSLKELEPVLGLRMSSFDGLHEILEGSTNEMVIDDNDPATNSIDGSKNDEKIGKNPLLPMGDKDLGAVDMVTRNKK